MPCSLPAAPAAVSQLRPPAPRPCRAGWTRAAQLGPPSLLPLSALIPPGGRRPAVGRQTPRSIQGGPWSPGGCKAPDAVPGRLPSPPPAHRRRWTSSWCPQRPRPGKARQLSPQRPQTNRGAPATAWPQPSGNSRFGKSREPWRSSARGHTPRGEDIGAPGTPVVMPTPPGSPCAVLGHRNPPQEGPDHMTLPVLSEWAPTPVPWGHCSGLWGGGSRRTDLGNPEQQTTGSCHPLHARSRYLGGRS